MTLTCLSVLRAQHASLLTNVSNNEFNEFCNQKEIPMPF